MISCSRNPIIRLFVHPLGWFPRFARVAGSSESAPVGIHLLSIFVHPEDSFRGLSLREFFLPIFDS